MRIFYGFAKWLPKKDDQKEGRMWQKSWNVSFSQNYILIKAIFFLTFTTCPEMFGAYYIPTYMRVLLVSGIANLHVSLK